ncbi:MAG: right-handed parallel beta-helix repeat-containing protein, partial [Bacteroidales bacterium]|nr:right-handed parallel beta-helix repeat-containing protein [Bacteroidales bacterium]
MRKLFLILLLSYLSASLSAQLSGTGTWTDPYSGTFQNDLQWNFANFPGGKIYIGGDITIDDELLTIEAGISVIFITEGADLIVNGTGRINASGTLNYQIIFTADDDNDSNYGESGERWGHIVFNNPSSTNQSKFEYCIIEYGDVGSGSNTTSYGGAIYSNTYSNFVLNNCTLRNNRASHGGAILLYTGASPSISNCLITENIATTTGGAIYSQAQSGLNLINCVISFNTAVASSGGGIFIDGSDNSRFINCNIVNNNSASGGRNIHFYAVSSSTVKPMFINSIAWGSDNSIEYSGFSIRTETDFVNCAIQDIATPASYFTDCIDLNSSNSATDGPNFNATDGSDWSIKFISPCRDTGTDSYSGVTIPTTDFEGNPRIQTTDIGAYECQYSSWTGATSTSWTTASNWEADIDPSTGTGDVVIPSGLSTYPVSASNPDFTIGSDNVMILEPGTRATLNNFTNNGSLTMQANASGLSSLIMASYSKGGTATENIQLYLTGGYIGDPEYNEGRWHYIATPVSNFSKNIFTANTND